MLGVKKSPVAFIAGTAVSAISIGLYNNKEGLGYLNSGI